MVNIIAIAFFYLAGISIFLIINELIYRRLDLEGELTRKFAHLAATLATLPFPYIFPSHWYVLVLALIFGLFLFVTWRSRRLGSIHSIKRKSWGSYLLPLSIYLTFLISDLTSNKFIYILPILILAVCDPLAAIFGINIKKMNGQIKIFGKPIQKTWVGSGTFFVLSFMISLIALYLHLELLNLKTFWLAMTVATAGTFAELVSWRGADNLTVPLSVVLVLLLFL
ncbi:phosphatidate cytidylyltransferase [Proteiniphilum saccharofermentans]|uniref:Phosphatidate cytidylyltransferase n=1 Tax=Proteiniphilum saccharofermentans TaxID=1642647 RepID=A0A1R3TBF3_9BACT|nr:phosphatidate cytidylyltransferase [Proteiniphilum saccharofermentans]SCD20924.1 phosphatidate cytidylyltransferase [Proteiniphilum saccharofermentans]